MQNSIVVVDDHPPTAPYHNFEASDDAIESTSASVVRDEPSTSPTPVHSDNDTAVLTYSASASEAGTSRGRRDTKKLASRQLRKFQKRIFRSQYQKRIQGRDSTTSDDEPIPPQTVKGRDNPKFLRFMPRPSDIVPAIDDGSASDAGYNTEEKNIHRRRKDATVVGLHSLDNEGHLQAVPTWTKQMHNLDRYTPFMDPPEADRHLRQIRVPQELLSRYYRGTFLVNRQLWNPRKRRKLMDGASIASGEELEFRDPDSSSQSGTEAAEPKNPEQESQAEEPEPLPDGVTIDPHGRGGASIPITFSKVKFLEFVNKAINAIEGPTVGELTAIREDKFEGPQLRREFSIQQTRQKNRPARTVAAPVQKKTTFYDGFISRLRETPDFLFTPINPSVDSAPPQPDLEEEATVKLSKFETEKKLALSYCWRSKPEDLISHFRGMPGKKRRSLVGTVGKKRKPRLEERVNLTSLKMMQKMGFKGRLGAKEDGPSEPVFATHQGFRSGLGATPSFVLENAGESLLPAEFSTRSKKSQGGSSGPQNRAPGPQSTIQGRLSPDRTPIRKLKKRKTGGGRKIGDMIVLDDSDASQAGDVGSAADNGRRAILIDFDSLLERGRSRRLRTFVAWNKRLKQKLNLKLGKKEYGEVLANDLSDEDAVRQLLGKGASDSDFAEGLAVLDELYRDKPPVLNMVFIHALKQQKVYFGLLHRGSKDRMKYEMDILGLKDSFLGGPASRVEGDAWPYIKTWNELRVLVGSLARQTMLISEMPPEHCHYGLTRLAGSYLGCMAGYVENTNSEAEAVTHCSLYAPGKPGALQWTVDKGPLMETRLPARKPRQVLAVNEDDLLWYAANVYAEDEETCWLEFCGLGKRAWIKFDELVDLGRGDYRKLKMKRFPGLLDCADAADL